MQSCHVHSVSTPLSCACKSVTMQSYRQTTTSTAQELRFAALTLAVEACEHVPSMALLYWMTCSLTSTCGSHTSRLLVVGHNKQVRCTTVANCCSYRLLHFVCYRNCIVQPCVIAVFITDTRYGVACTGTAHRAAANSFTLNNHTNASNRAASFGLSR